VAVGTAVIIHKDLVVALMGVGLIVLSMAEMLNILLSLIVVQDLPQNLMGVSPIRK
jgi:hypothetical protein